MKEGQYVQGAGEYFFVEYLLVL